MGNKLIIRKYIEEIINPGVNINRVGDGGAKMIFPAHGKPFPVDIIKKYLDL